MLGGIPLLLIQQEQLLVISPVVLSLTVPNPTASFGTPPLRKFGSYSPSISHDGSYTPSITKTQVGDV